MRFNKNSSKISILLFNFMILLSFNSYTAEISALASSCTEALNKRDYVTAAKTSESLLKQAPNDREGLLCKGRALGALGKYDDALSAFDAANKQSAPGFEQVVSYLFIGNLHKDKNKNTEAIAAYEKSINICEAEKNDKYKRISLNLKADAQSQNKDFNNALTSNMAGYKLAMNDNERADSLERLAATYKVLGKHDEAIEYQLKGVNMQKKAGTLDQYANASLALGDIYIAAKDYISAENTFAKLVKFSNEQGGAYFEAKADVGLAQTKTASGDAAAAKVFVEKAKIIAKDSKDKALEQEIELAIKNN